MAGFNKHLTAAAAVSGLAAAVLCISTTVSHRSVIDYFAFGVIGGLLPDVDSPTSVSVRITFAALPVLVGFLVLFIVGRICSLLELVVLWIVCSILIRYILSHLLARFTIHRGLMHTVPSGVCFGMITTTVSYHLFSDNIVYSWLCGTFITLGFIVHLLLDELHSIDLLGRRKLLKSSFGTAFSFGKLNNPIGTAVLYLSIFFLFFLCPPIEPFTKFMLDRSIHHSLAQLLIPSSDRFPGLIKFVQLPYQFLIENIIHSST
jgi:hypothetical protein